MHADFFRIDQNTPIKVVVLNTGAYEIMGQLVNADGQLVGAMRRYSDMGSVDTDTAFDAAVESLSIAAGAVLEPLRDARDGGRAGLADEMGRGVDTV